MTRIIEESKWEDEVPLLGRNDRVAGGIDGASNKQAQKLANRTRHLKDELDSFSDYREYTFYMTPEDPEGVISGVAGTPEGKGFRVAVQDASGVTAVYNIYRNVGGVAQFVNSQPSQRYIYDVMLRTLSMISDFGGAKDYAGVIADEFQNVVQGFRDNGRVHIPLLEHGDSVTKFSEVGGYQDITTDDYDNIVFGIKDDSTVHTPRLHAGDAITQQIDAPGWEEIITDPYGNIISGIRSNGEVFPSKSEESAEVKSFGAKDGDNIVILGDSYTDSLFTLKDKSYIGNLSALSDYRFRNYGISGNTATAINKRLVDGASYFDGRNFADMNAKYAFIMTYQNDSAYFINHAMEYYMYNIERLIDSVMAYGAVPIIVSEWVASTSAAVQLKAICNRRGITFIDNGNLMKEVGNLVQSPFHQGHPGTRTNGVIWASLYEFVRRMPRPTRSIKIYRQRPTFVPASDADMLFSGDIERATKWKEVTISHRSLPDSSEPYFEELRGRGNVTTWQVRADEYDLLGATGVSFTERLLVNITYPAGATGLSLVGFSISCSDGVEVYVRHILDSASSIGQTGDVTPGATDANTLTSDYLAKYANPRGAWQKMGVGSGEYSFGDDLQQVMFGDQVQLMLKSASGTLVDITASYQAKDNAAMKTPTNSYRPQSQLLAETFDSFTSWTVSNVTTIVPLDQSNTPRNLAYSGALSSVASLMNGSTMQKTVAVAIPSTRDFTQPFTMQVELWGRYFPKAYLDNSIYGLDSAQVVDSSQSGNEFPAASPITSDTCDFRSVALRCSIGNAMTPQNTITQRDFACLFWRPLKYIVEIPAYSTASQLVLNITAESDNIQLAKIIIKEVK